MLRNLSRSLLHWHIIALYFFMTLESPLVILEGGVSGLMVAFVVIDFILLSFTGIEVTTFTPNCLYITLRSFASL